MGERDEEVEELRADLSDVKQMYREQIDMLVSQIERLSVAMGSS
jgi:prefoldin subunit 5